MPHIQHVDQQAAAFDVLQEIVAESPALAGAFDQSGQVRHDEGETVIDLDHAELRRQSGEGIIGDLGSRGRDDRQQRGFADAGVADQTDIRQKLQLHDDVEFLSGDTEFEMLRCGVAGSCEMTVSLSAGAAFTDDLFLIRCDQIRDHIAVIRTFDQRSLGDRDDHIVAVGTEHLLVLAAFAVAGLDDPVEAEVEQRGLVGIDLEDDRTAPAAVAAVRSAERHVLLMTKGSDPVAAVACLQMYLNFIDKLHTY